MNNEELIEIANAKNDIETITQLGNKFLERLQANAEPEGVPAKLVFEEDGEFKVESFVNDAKCSSRIVKTNTGYAVEYLFIVPLSDDESLEVLRFYLREDARLYRTADGDEHICDFDNRYVSKRICGGVILGSIASKLYVPTPQKDA